MPSISLAVSLRGQLLSGTRSVVPAFSPIDLFSLNEPGVWYDPSDLTTLFTDTAGTTPVTTPAQTVALMLDKSKGLTLGPELVVNGTFATDLSGWPNNTGATWDAGAALLSATSASAQLAQSFTTVVGRTYRLNYQFVSGNTGNSIVRVGTAPNDASNVSVGMSAGPGSFSRVFVATSTTSWVTLFVAYPAVSITGKWDNISVRELAGNHATQSTTASRPTYGVVPLGGRRNLLTWSEDYSDAVWSKVNCSISTATASGPFGGNNGSLITFPASGNSELIRVNLFGGGVVGTTATYSVYLKYDSWRWFALTSVRSGSAVNSWIDLQNGVSGTVNHAGFSITPAQGGWIRVSFQVGSNGLDTVYISARPSNGSSSAATGNAGSGFFTCAAQLDAGSTATAYQRVTTAFDVTEAGVQSLSYLSFDGVDDGMVTGTITPGVDKAQVFAGVRKLSDPANMTVAELGVLVTSTNGSLALITSANDGVSRNTYTFSTRGTATVSPVTNGYVAPITNVVTGLGDISGDTATLRVNGSQVAQSTADQGTGNFLAYPLYIGRRAGTTLPFNGQIYSLITRFGANLDTTAITNTETWVAGKTGVTL